MRFCFKCGKELDDYVQICPRCNAHVNEPATEVLSPKKKQRIKSWWIVGGCAALVLVILAAALFLPRNLKMGDFRKVNTVTGILNYGIPASIRMDEDGNVTLHYRDKMDFYGITPMSCMVEPDENQVVFFFPNEVSDEVYQKIKHYCEFEESLLGIYHIFSYGNLEITTYDYDGGYVCIEMMD